ncbi:MAG: hypothetical protein EOP01_10365 [Propionibacteriaceae bacterium]|nr:MAG: hypothetical protein EOP01_10365 [Propionibacteriaceae bacterium]
MGRTPPTDPNRGAPVSVYLSRPFWRAALERAVKSTAQGAVGGGVTAAILTDGHAAAAAGLSAAFLFVLSILTSLASAQVGESGTPSLTGAETLTDGSDAGTPPLDPR